MITSILIYLRAVFIYAIITLPAMFMPIIYLVSIMYVLFYGWFACALFTIIYLIVTRLRLSYETKMFLLGTGVIPSVLFAFQMLEVLKVEDDIWQSGGYLIFPVLAVITGWISLGFSRKKVMETCMEYAFDKNDTEVN